MNGASRGAGTGAAYYPSTEPTPWALGITVAALVAALTTVGVYAFGAALAQVHPLVSIAVNVAAAAGVAPTAWRWRTRPVTRWVLAGAAIGIVGGWCGLLLGS